MVAYSTGRTIIVVAIVAACRTAPIVVMTLGDLLIEANPVTARSWTLVALVGRFIAFAAFENPPALVAPAIALMPQRTAGLGLAVTCAGIAIRVGILCAGAAFKSAATAVAPTVTVVTEGVARIRVAVTCAGIAVRVGILCTGAAFKSFATAIGYSSALNALFGTGGRNAWTLAADIRRSSAATGLGKGASAAVDRAATAIWNGPAVVPQRIASLRLAVAGAGVAVRVGILRAGAAVDRAAALVIPVAAFMAQIVTGSWGAGALASFASGALCTFRYAPFQAAVLVVVAAGLVVSGIHALLLARLQALIRTAGASLAKLARGAV
jgi:hypothetical protein